MYNKKQQYDFVIINAPLPDDFGTRFVTDVTRGNGTVALLIVRAESYEDIRAKVVSKGIFYPVETHLYTDHYPSLGMDGRCPGTPAEAGKQSYLHRRKNGGDPSGKPGKVAVDRKSENDRIRCPSLHRKASHGSLLLQKEDFSEHHQNIFLKLQTAGVNTGGLFVIQIQFAL